LSEIERKEIESIGDLTIYIAVNLKLAPFRFYPIYQWMSTTILIFLAEFLPFTLNDGDSKRAR